MTTQYVDPDTIHIPASGTVPPASWGTQIRNNQVAFAKPPMCVLTSSGPQSLTTGGASTIVWNGSELVDTDGFHSKTVDVDTITIPTGFDGWYNISWWVIFGSHSTGRRFSGIGVNGNSMHSISGLPSNTGATHHCGSGVIKLVGGDAVTIRIRQDSGTTIDVADNRVALHLISWA